MLNGKQSVTICLAFRLCKQRLNGVKRSKQFCTTPQKMHIHALKTSILASIHIYALKKQVYIFMYVTKQVYIFIHGKKLSIHLYACKNSS